MDSFLLQLQQTSWMEWLGTGTGLVAVVLSIREKLLAWPLYIACYGLYVILSFRASLPAAMLLNAVFIPISIYGWWKWMHPDRNNNSTNSVQLAITQITSSQMLWISTTTILLSGIWGIVNAQLIRSAYPYLDAFATVTSFIAQWMLSRKYAENWIAWLIADIAFAILWGLQGYWVTVLMFFVFTGLALSGWISWRKEVSRV